MMAIKQKKNALEGITTLISKLPWWVGITIAVVGYVVLHRMAVKVPMANVQSGQLSAFMTQSIIAGFATVGQYLVPLVGVIGALLSYVGRKKRLTLVANVSDAGHASALNSMPWPEFELLVGEAFRLQGYRVQETGGGGPDGGIDLILTKGREKFLVQCKQWKAFKVGVEVVRELHGVMAAQGATGGFVVTSGRFTGDAKEFAQGLNVQLIDGAKLFTMIQQARRSLDGPGKASVVKQEPGVTKRANSPACPRCGATMVKRTARKGDSAGEEFWGCSEFPRCRGVVKVNRKY